MNQNYNNNEYEILDNGGISNQPRYPLAQAPGSEWQNMNYTDWVNRCNCGEPGELFNDTTTAVRNGLIIGTGVGWALLGLIPVIGGPASAIAGLFNVLIPYWWPEQAGNPGTAQAQFTWEQLMSAVETITDKKILNFKKSDAIARWQGIQLLTRDYYLKLCDWINDQTSPSKQAAVKDAFDDVEDYIKISMPFFEAQGFQVQMLSMYAQAASMHLLLLRDVVKYGVGWGYEPYEVERYYSHIGLGNKGLLQLIADYTDHCVVWYNTGLQEQYNTGDWNKFNDFRRDMTIMVLDIVSIWPTFDPRLYTVPTKSQLTRTVYTRVSGDTGGGNITVEPTLPIDVVESNVVDIPRLFSWLRELTIDADNFPSSSPGRFDMKGRGLKRQNTLSNTIEVGGYKGEAGNRQQTLSIPSPQSNDDVWKIDTLIRIAFNDGSRAVNGWDFKFTQSPNQHLYGTPFFPQEVAGFPCKGQNLRPCEPCVSCSSELPDMNVPCNDKSLYSHRYSYMGLGMLTYNSTTPFRYAAYFSNGWTHVSADANNLIDLEKITQIPAVKGYSLTGTSRVIKGPGSTGGDLVKLSASGMLGLAITEPSGTHAYRVRIRYACNMDINILVLNEVTAELGRFIAPATTTDMTNLTYDKFGYLDTLVYSYSSLEDVNNGLNIYNLGSDEATIILDKIEFIPIQGSVETYEADQALEKARKAVNDLFPNDAKNTLRLHVTDYLVDQAANLVECISDEVHPKEKMCLLDQVKVAKRLSQARNLLHHGDFESPDWSGENGWKTSNHVSVTSGNPIFKGRYLHMPGAENPQFSDQVFPTYMYQKIDESKLKPYTRYLVRGFVGNSKDLALLVARYDKEVHKNMNVPNDIPPMNPCTGEYHLGEGPMLTNYTIPQDMSCDPCEAGTVMKVQQTFVKCEDPHVFSFHIDTGELDMERNLGIWVGFKIGTTDGMATVDNLEVIEANPLTGEALSRVKKREQKWKQKWTEKRMKIETAVQTAQGAIQALFTNANQNPLKPDITLNDILQAENLVQRIPYVYNEFLQGALPPVPGETYDIFLQLSSAVASARSLYEQRNVLRNGDFMAGLSNWKGAKDAIVQKIGNASVLVISDWSATLSQDVCVNPEQGYILRVTAKKEDSGEGYVTISDGTNDNTETLKFTADEEMTSMAQSDIRSPIRERYQERNMVNASEEAYGTNGYASNPMANYPSDNDRANTHSRNNYRTYPSESFGITPYSDENPMTDYPTNKYEMNTYPGSTNMTNPNGGCSCGCSTNTYAGENMMMNASSNANGSGYGCGCRTYINNSTDSYASPMTARNGSSLSGYVTKTVEIFPETNRVCIEIGETSGTFKVESIELIRMDCE